MPLNKLQVFRAADEIESNPGDRQVDQRLIGIPVWPNPGVDGHLRVSRRRHDHRVGAFHAAARPEFGPPQRGFIELNPGRSHIGERGMVSA